ncbi:MAG: hypothetical protein ACRYGG_11415 [Janthinobacterium lividum]
MCEFAKHQPADTALALLAELYRLQGIARLADDLRRQHAAALPAEDPTMRALGAELDLYEASRVAATSG